MVMITEIFFAVYPLYAFTPIELGGLGLSEAEIGVHMSVRSIIMVCGLFFFPRLAKRYGRLAVYRITLVTWIPTILLFPILNWIIRGHMGGKGGVAWYIGFFTLFTLWSITGWSWSKLSPSNPVLLSFF
jgi:Na+/melibiose symporter-like transporter